MLMSIWSKGNTVSLLARVPTCTSSRNQCGGSSERWEQIYLKIGYQKDDGKQFTSYTTPGHISKGCSNLFQGDLINHVHCCSFHIQKLKGKYMSLNRRTENKENMVRLHNRTLLYFFKNSIMIFVGKCIELENNFKLDNQDRG